VSPKAKAGFGATNRLSATASLLGLAESSRPHHQATAGEVDEDPAFGPWAKSSVTRARTLLNRDGGAAWRRVTKELLREHRLSGATVYSLVHRPKRKTTTPRVNGLVEERARRKLGAAR